MKDAVLRILANPAVRKAFLALVLAVAAAAGVSFGSGCGRNALPPAAAKALATYECQVGVLEGVVPLAVAEDLVMAARAGNGSYVVQQLLGLGLTPEVIEQAAGAFHECSGATAKPSAPAAITPA